MVTMRPRAPSLRQQFSKMPVSSLLAKIRPRLVRELVLLPFREELIVDGTSYLQILRGKSTRNVLPAVMALLDGTRTLLELESAVPGVPAEHVQTTVSLLFNCGLIENGVAEPDPTANQQTLDFFRRHVGVTGTNSSGEQAYKRLQTSEVVILGGGRQEQALKSVLETTGVGRVLLLDRESLNGLSPASGLRQSNLSLFLLRSAPRTLSGTFRSMTGAGIIISPGCEYLWVQWTMWLTLDRCSAKSRARATAVSRPYMARFPRLRLWIVLQP